MKNRKTIVIGFTIILLIIGGVFVFSENSKLFQGYFGKGPFGQQQWQLPKLQLPFTNRSKIPVINPNRINDVTSNNRARSNLLSYLRHPASAWVQKIKTENQSILNFIQVRPGMAIEDGPMTIYFDFLPTYRNRVTSIIFTIEDINSLQEFHFVADQVQAEQVIITIPTEQVENFGTANCMSNFDVELDDGSEHNVQLSAAVCFNKLDLNQPFADYDVFEGKNIFLIIPNSISSDGDEIVNVLTDCQLQVSQLFNQSYIPQKNIAVIEDDNRFYDIASFGHLVMGNNNLENLEQMNVIVHSGG